VDKAPLVKGSHGQLMLNPLNRRIRELSEEIAKVSDRFGMNPMARWRLQFTVSEAGKSTEDLLKMLNEGVEMPDSKDAVDADGYRILDLEDL